ncbi:MAG: hypothetical protein ACE5G9_12990 [Nitrospinales bacterium]
MNLKKYRQAGWGFLILNIIWLIVFSRFLLLMNIGAFVYVAGGFCLLLIAALAWFVGKGSRKLTFVLALIYAVRSMASIYTVATGVAFPAVPYVLPCLLVSFYLLGRAVWGWP